MKQNFCPHLGCFCVVSSSLRFGQISPLAFFRWLTTTSDRNAESCNCIPINSQIKKPHLKMIPIKDKNETLELFINNSESDFLNKYFSYFLEENILIVMFYLLYHRGEWYTEKNECLIYLYSTRIRCKWIHSKTWYNNLQTINKTTLKK